MRRTHEGTKVHWLPAVANIAAPTAAEVAAGTDLSDQVTIDGLGIDSTQNTASQAMLGSSFVGEEPGTYGTAVTLTTTREDVGDLVWDLFDYRTTGFLLVSRFGEPVVGAAVEVYPAKSHKPIPLASAENEYQKVQVRLAIHDEPELKAVVAA